MSIFDQLFVVGATCLACLYLHTRYRLKRRREIDPEATYADLATAWTDEDQIIVRIMAGGCLLFLLLAGIMGFIAYRELTSRGAESNDVRSVDEQ